MASNTGSAARKPVIGVTGNSKFFSPSWLCIKIALTIVGAAPVRISTRHHHRADRIDGLIVSGGDDIHPFLYGGEEGQTARYDTARDALEKRYIEFALLKGLPVLGICRGYQLLNVVLGGSLFDDIRHLRKTKPIDDTILPKREIDIFPDSSLNAILSSTKIRVNSLHHQAVERLGDGLEINARDLDGIVQGLESTGQNQLLGIQWHPEYLFYMARQLSIFRWLKTAAAKSVTLT